MAATVYPGLMGSANWVHPDNRPKDWGKKAIELFPNSRTKLSVLVQTLSKKKVMDYEYKDFEKRLPVMAITVNGAIASTTTTSIVFDTPATPLKSFKAGDIFYNESTAEVLRLAADPVSPYLTGIFERGFGGSTAANIGDNNIFRKIGSAYGSGTMPPQAIFRETETVTNYLQIQKEAAKIDKSSLKMSLRPWSNIKSEAQAQALERWMLGLEMSLLFGEGTTPGTDSQGNRLSSTKGINSLITTNRFDCSSGLDLDSWEDDLQQAFQYGSDTKVCLCGATFYTIINRMASRNSLLNYTSEDIPREQTYGIKFKEWNSPHGTLALVKSPLLSESTTLTKWGFVLDFKYLEYVYLNGRDLHFNDNVEPNGADYWMGEYLGEVGLRLTMEEVHSVFYGLGSYIA